MKLAILIIILILVFLFEVALFLDIRNLLKKSMISIKGTGYDKKNKNNLKLVKKSSK
ncbi:hypothetical protein [Abyssisolibacter fermentans]|uniref:hypothetical protein n=1 Tax=Abyssisolibacter fermentans TaxID=1766203 RepID=UPI0012E3F244|nr:hypothetical protein [Abyssisolibacter fermentans]